MVYSPATTKLSNVTNTFKPVWTADQKTRAKLLSFALLRSQTDFGTLLLFYLVQDFEAAPTKTKFYALYDAYFADQVTRMCDSLKKKGKEVPSQSNRTPTKLPMDVSHNYTHTYTQLARLAEMGEMVELLSDISKNKNILDRIMTSHQRKIPGDIFDDLVGEIVVSRGKDTLAESVGASIKTEGAFEDLNSIVQGKLTQTDPYFEKNLKTVKGAFGDVLKKAGFDLKKCGIADMAKPA